MDKIESLKKGLPELKKKTKKGVFKGKFIKKPKTKIQGVNPQRFISKDSARQSLVREGRTGYFNQEMMEEAKWLS